MNQVKSQAYLRKRKMMLVLPVLVIPFLTLAFKSLGGGKAPGNPDTREAGLNLHVPDPKVKGETPLDKLGFYNQADKDSLKLEEQLKNDPYYQARLQQKQPESPDDLPEYC